MVQSASRPRELNWIFLINFYLTVRPILLHNIWHKIFHWYWLMLMNWPLSAVNVLSRGDLLPGLHNRTVPSAEHDKSCILEACIDSPHTASVWATRVSDKTFGSEETQAQQVNIDVHSQILDTKQWYILVHNMLQLLTTVCPTWLRNGILGD